MVDARPLAVVVGQGPPAYRTLTREQYDALWQCSYCKAWKPVPSLARDCEERHHAREPKSLTSSAS